MQNRTAGPLCAQFAWTKVMMGKGPIIKAANGNNEVVCLGGAECFSNNDSVMLSHLY